MRVASLEVASALERTRTAVPEAQIKNIEPLRVSYLTSRSTTALAPIRLAFPFISRIASVRPRASASSYVADRLPSASVKDAAKSRRMFAPHTVSPKTGQKYSTMSCVSIVSVVETIKSCRLDASIEPWPLGVRHVQQMANPSSVWASQLGHVHMVVNFPYRLVCGYKSLAGEIPSLSFFAFAFDLGRTPRKYS